MTGRVKRAAKQVDTEPGKWPTNGLDYKPIKWPTNPIDVPTPSLLGQSQRTTIGKCGVRNLHLLGFCTKAVRLRTATIVQKVVVWLTRTLGHKAHYTLVKTYLFWALNSFFFYEEFYYHVTILIDFEIA